MFMSQCELAGVKIQLNHCLKIINMQDKRLEDLQAAVDTVSAICSEYHQLLNGLNMVTDNMNNTYQQVHSLYYSPIQEVNLSSNPSNQKFEN